VDSKVYMIPEVVMVDILKVINSLPYGQIAPLANTLGQIIKDQRGETNLTDERT